MNTVRKVAKNTGVVIVWNIVTKVISLLISVYLARYLGVIEYGNYSFIISYALFFSIFIDIGINNFVVREISRDRKKTDKLIANGIGIKLALFVFVFLLAFSAINFTGYSSEIKIGVLIALSSLIFSSLVSLLSTLFQADLKIEYPALADLASKLVLGGAVLFISYQKGGMLSIILATLIASIISFIIIYVFSLSRIHIRAEFNKKTWREILGPSVLLGFSTVFASVIVGADTILISLIRGNMEVGYYAIPSQLTDALNFIPVAFMTSLIPLMSAYSKTSKQSLDKSSGLALKYMLALGIPIAFGTTFLAGRIITALYGAQFLPSSPVLMIMTWCEVLLFCIATFDGLLLSIDKQKIIFTAAGISAIFNILLNLLLIPLFGFIGAGVALLLSYTLMTALHLYLVPGLWRLFNAGFIIKSVLASSIMVIFIQYTTTALHIYILLPVSALLYFIALAVLGGVSSEDIEILNKIIART